MPTPLVPLCPARPRWRLPFARLVALAAALVMLSQASVSAAPEKRELQAREAFAAGRYNDALDLFAKLYAEKLHPTYLRNIGRCYQNLGDPDHAISSFRDYLRQAKDVKPAERAEVEGYIREMEELKRQKAEAARPTPPPAGAPVATAPPTPLMISAPAPEPPPPAPHFYQRGLFWAVVGAVVVGGTIGVLAGTGAFSSKKDPSCPAGVSCQ